MTRADANAEQLPHLATFATAAELNSFTAAARSLALSQAAVSQRVHALEKALGVALFHRQGGRVILTEHGQQLYPFAQRISLLHREAREAVTGRPAPVMGELSLAASSVPGEHLLPELLSTFRARHPRIKVRATVTDSAQVLAQVEEGQAHLGLVGARMGHPQLEFRCFARDHLVLIVPSGHPWDKRKRVSLAQLSREPLIWREAGSGSRWCLERALGEAGKSQRDLRITLELGSNEAIKEAVVRGVGLAFLSTHVIQGDVQVGRLHALQVAGLTLTRDMYVVWHRQRALPVPARLFLDLLMPSPATSPDP